MLDAGAAAPGTVPTERIGWLLDSIQKLAGRTNATIYSIHQRHQGWAIEWHEVGRQGAYADFRRGLVIYGWYASFGECLAAEAARVMAAVQVAGMAAEAIAGMAAMKSAVRR